jgi:hypothetical protein
MEQEIISDVIADRISRMDRVRNSKRASKYIASVVKNRGLDNDKKSRGLTLLKNDSERQDEEEELKFRSAPPNARKQT